MTKSNLTNAINECQRGEKAFVPYIMAGDDGIQTLKKKHFISTRNWCHGD